MLPGVTTKEKSENIEEFTSLIESNELDSSRPEWVDESFKKAFENGSDSLITPNGIHQDVNVDDYDNVITYGKDDLLTKKATFKKTQMKLFYLLYYFCINNFIIFLYRIFFVFPNDKSVYFF
jgi:hypothetical protein